jgi:sulfur carrier protein ThiS
MRVQVRLLGTFRRYLPPDTAPGVEHQVESGTTVENLLEELPFPLEDALVVLVNGRAPTSAQVLHEGDVISVFPAAAGG